MLLYSLRKVAKITKVMVKAEWSDSTKSSCSSSRSKKFLAGYHIPETENNLCVKRGFKFVIKLIFQLSHKQGMCVAYFMV